MADDLTARLDEKTEKMNDDILSASSERNNKFFDEEIEKLDCWADDMKLALEREITDLDQEIN